jgi:acyl-CoA synthetase (AMP-forming)/AMP-acid ligase II
MTYNLADIFESLADAVPGNIALVSGDLRLTFAQVDDRATRLANQLGKQGIGPGAHVGLQAFNCHQYLEAMIACFKLRAVPININYRYVADELVYLYQNADLKALVFQQALGTEVAKALAQCPDLGFCLQIGDESQLDHGIEAPFYEALVSAGDPTRAFPERSGQDLFIVYTGGTTGMPRGVMWQHEDLFFAGLQGGAPGGDPVESPTEMAKNATDEGLVIHPAAPLIHGASMFASWISWFTAGKVVLVPGRSFDAERSVALIDEEQLNVINLVGDAMALPVLDALEASDTEADSLVTISSAGAILSGSIRTRLVKRLPDCMIMNNFGASETGHQGTAFYEDDEDPDAKPIWVMGEHTHVIDDDGQPIEPGSGVVGWLARTGRMPLGYYGDPEKTARTFKVVNGVRYVIPGDMATVHEDGTITVFGRGAICINSGGEKVFPEEVEEALKAHPEVTDAIVVGVPDARWGERVEALVQLRSGSAADSAALETHCRNKLAGYKTPRAIYLLDSLERQPSGKPDYTWAKATVRTLSS